MPIASCSICFEDLLDATPSKGSGQKENNSRRHSLYEEPGGPPPNLRKSPSEASDLLSVSSTPCGHVFHTHCVSQWIGSHGDCPQCRRKVQVPDLVQLFLAEDANQRERHYQGRVNNGTFTRRKKPPSAGAGAAGAGAEARDEEDRDGEDEIYRGRAEVGGLYATFF